VLATIHNRNFNIPKVVGNCLCNLWSSIILHIKEVLPYELGKWYNNKFQDVGNISMCLYLKSPTLQLRLKIFLSIPLRLRLVLLFDNNWSSVSNFIPEKSNGQSYMQTLICIKY
jgi:hypothetical protein